MQREFLENIGLLDFGLFSSESGLLFTGSIDTQSFEDLLIIEQARQLKADAVLVRRFSEHQTAIPQVYIYDNSLDRLTDEEHTEIHKKIWTSGIVPVYYIFDKTQVRIFDARKPVEDKNRIQTVRDIECIPLVAKAHELYEKYSAKLFANGTFWEQPELKTHFSKNKSAEADLLDGLKKTREKLKKKTGLDPKIVNRLIVLSILVKYLEERKDEQGNHVFPSDYFNKYKGSSCFCDVLRVGELNSLFHDLSIQFNGKIFELDEEEKRIIGHTDLGALADYLDANNKNDQFVIWRLYSFEHLPVELISRIYEEFMPEERNDAVYTPVHLARFMVDECMPINEPKENFKVIDVSCGSGIFLVTAYKRLVQWWQKRQYDTTGQFVKPNVKVLKEILLESIHGVDIEPEAVRLSVFSLSLALCDMLSPTEIWTELKFQNLRKTNIYNGNFFECIGLKGEFDLVIGNPPFERYTEEKYQALINKFNIEIEFKISGNQIALLFVQKAMNLLTHGGLLSLILPSSSFLYGNTISFRKDFFERYNVPQIIDLTNLSSSLFNANVATCVLFAEKKIPTTENIYHITIRKTIAATKGMYFEIDGYDINQVPKDLAASEPFIWKTNLLGGSILFYIVDKFKGQRSLEDYLRDKESNSNWVYGEGYKRNSKVKKLSDDNKAEYLTGKYMVPTDSFDEYGIHNVKIETSEYFESPRKEKKKIFLKPHILMKNALGKRKLPIHFIDEDLGFMREIVGIHAPVEDTEELLKLESDLKNQSDLYRFLILSTSGRAGIDRSIYTLKKEDLMNLPYPEDLQNLKLSFAEQIVCDDVLNYGLDSLSKGELALVNKSLASGPQLNDFSKVLCESLNPIYARNHKKFYALTPIAGTSFYCVPIVYGNPSDNVSIAREKIESGDFSSLLENKQESVLYKRVLRLYQNDIVYLIKPKTLRYWIKSIALRDASEIIVDLVNSGF